VREWGSEWESEECSRLISSLCIYLYIAELIVLHEIKSAMDIAVYCDGCCCELRNKLHMCAITTRRWIVLLTRTAAEPRSTTGRGRYRIAAIE